MAGAAGNVSGHPVLRAAVLLSAALDEAAGAWTWSLSTGQQRDALVVLARVESRLAELRLRVVRQAEADDVGAQTGATSTAAWHADATGQTPPQTSRLARQAKKLDTHDAVREALADGALRLDQAEVICAAVDALPGRPGRRPGP